MVTAIVGNNDGSDGSHACMRMRKDLEGLLESLDAGYPESNEDS